MTTVTAETAPRSAFREVWLISAGHMMTHWYPATLYLLLPLIGNELRLSFSQIGSILTCQFTAGPLANMPGGMVVDAIGRKGLLMAVALSWIGVPYLVMGFSHSYWMLLVCAAMVGIGNNLWHPTAIPLLAQNHPERRGLVVSIHAMGGNLGDAIAPLAVGAMLTVFSWRDVVVMNVVPGVVASILLLLSLGRIDDGGSVDADRPSAGRRGAVDIFAGVRILFANRTVLMLSLGSAVRAMTAMTLLTFLPVFLSSDLGYSPAWVGASLFALQAAGFAAAPVSGHLSDRMGRRSVIMTSMVMSGVVLLFMAFAGLRAVRRLPGLLPVRDPRGAAGMAPRCNAEAPGRHQRRHHVRSPSRGRRDRPSDRRPGRRQLPHHRGVLFPGCPHRGRQHVHFLHAAGADRKGVGWVELLRNPSWGTKAARPVMG